MNFKISGHWTALTSIQNLGQRVYHKKRRVWMIWGGKWLNVSWSGRAFI